MRGRQEPESPWSLSLTYPGLYQPLMGLRMRARRDTLLYAGGPALGTAEDHEVSAFTFIAGPHCILLAGTVTRVTVLGRVCDSLLLHISLSQSQDPPARCGQASVSAGHSRVSGAMVLLSPPVLPPGQGDSAPLGPLCDLGRSAIASLPT